MSSSLNMNKYYTTRQWADHQVAKALKLSENLIHRLQTENRRTEQNSDKPKQDQRRIELEELRTLNRLLKKRRAELTPSEKSSHAKSNQLSVGLRHIKSCIDIEMASSGETSVSPRPQNFGSPELCSPCAEQVHASFSSRSWTEKSVSSCSQTSVNKSLESKVVPERSDFLDLPSPSVSTNGRIRWRQKRRYLTNGGIRVTICNAKEDPNAIL